MATSATRDGRLEPVGAGGRIDWNVVESMTGVASGFGAMPVDAAEATGDDGEGCLTANAAVVRMLGRAV